jgi:hypothetical protein
MEPQIRHDMETWFFRFTEPKGLFSEVVFGPAQDGPMAVRSCLASLCLWLEVYFEALAIGRGDDRLSTSMMCLTTPCSSRSILKQHQGSNPGISGPAMPEMLKDPSDRQ